MPCKQNGKKIYDHQHGASILQQEILHP
jgi:hypothetical protein